MRYPREFPQVSYLLLTWHHILGLIERYPWVFLYVTKCLLTWHDISLFAERHQARIFPCVEMIADVAPFLAIFCKVVSAKIWSRILLFANVAPYLATSISMRTSSRDKMFADVAWYLQFVEGYSCKYNHVSYFFADVAPYFAARKEVSARISSCDEMFADVAWYLAICRD